MAEKEILSRFKVKDALRLDGKDLKVGALVELEIEEAKQLLAAGVLEHTGDSKKLFDELADKEKK